MCQKETLTVTESQIYQWTIRATLNFICHHVKGSCVASHAPGYGIVWTLQTALYDAQLIKMPKVLCKDQMDRSETEMSVIRLISDQYYF